MDTSLQIRERSSIICIIAIDVWSVKPRSWLFDLFGDYVEHREKEIWVATVIALGAEFDLSERAIRSAVLRLQRDGWLKVHRRGQRSFYALTEGGRSLIDKGRERIFRGPERDWKGCWVILTYSIPERQRDLRDKLRRELSWLGFGGFTSGVFVSPHERQAELVELANRHGLGDRVTIFRAEHIWPADNRSLAARCWDLEGINASYSAFVAEFEPDAGRMSMTDRDCFVARFRLINAYRRFPFIDPGLPGELLPDNWLGGKAAELFACLHARLAAGAARYFDAVCQGSGASQVLG